MKDNSMNDFLSKVTRIYEAEQALGAKVTRADQVPPTYDAITADWLSAVICKDQPGAEVTSFSFDKEDDGTSNRRRIFLTYNAAGQRAGFPPSVFCKAAATLTSRFVLGSSGSARGEANFFNIARPQLDILTPEPIFSGYNPDNYAYFIMMKDMAGQDSFPIETHVMTREQAEGMVDTLARLHSRFYQDPALGTAALPFDHWSLWWKRMVTESPNFERYCDIAFGDCEHLMSPALFARRAEIWPKTMASAEAHKGLPSSLTHNDVHLKNWFISADNRMGLHDWQAVGYGHWSRDYIYATTCALSIEQRRAWEVELLDLYLDKMAERGVPRVSHEEAMRNCRQQLLTALAFWTITLRPAPEMADMQPASTTLTFLSRMLAAMDDHDALDAFD